MLQLRHLAAEDLRWHTNDKTLWSHHEYGLIILPAERKRLQAKAERHAAKIDTGPQSSKSPPRCRASAFLFLNSLFVR